MKAPVTETIRHVVINLVPYHINGINKILPYDDYNDNRDRNHDNRDRRDYHRNDRDTLTSMYPDQSMYLSMYLSACQHL